MHASTSLSPITSSKRAVPPGRRGLEPVEHLRHLVDLPRIDVAKPGKRHGLVSADESLDVLRHDAAAADNSQADGRRRLVGERVKATERRPRGQGRRRLGRVPQEPPSRGLVRHGKLLWC